MERKTFGQNLALAWHHISTYVALGASAGAAGWMQLDGASQQAIVEAFPAVKVLAPLGTLVAFVIAKGIPQAPRGPDGRPLTTKERTDDNANPTR